MIQRRPLVRVLVVDSSSAQRAELLQTLQRDGDIAVLGVVETVAATLAFVAQARPDVVVLDLQLSDGGRHAIEQLMAHHPTPILAISSGIANRRSPSAVEALVSGALDAVRRPVSWTPELGEELRRTVHQISTVGVIRHPRGNRPTTSRTEPLRTMFPPPSASRSSEPQAEADRALPRAPVVAIAASTGGPSALAIVLAGLAGLPAPVLVVQHLHPDFTTGLLEWMARASALPAELAQHGQTPRPGHVYLAPGGFHLRLGVSGKFELRTLPATLHRPSADQLFESVADQRRSAIGVLLTGMGDDGARGLLAIHDAGGQTFAQDEASCAVFGMPRAARRLGAVTDLHPLDQLAAVIQRAARAVTV